MAKGVRAGSAQNDRGKRRNYSCYYGERKQRKARSLSDFAYEAQRMDKMPLLGVECDNIHSLYSEDYYKAYGLTYHIYSTTDKSFQGCFKVIAELLDLLGKFFISEEIKCRT